jgi:hypothetical protein
MNSTALYIYIYMKICALTPLCPHITNCNELGAQFRHVTPVQVEASTTDHHDCLLPEEGHHVAPAQVFIELCTSGKGTRDHDTLHHITVLELVPDGVRLVWVGLLKDSLEVVCRWPRPTLVAMCGSRDVPHVEAACLPVVVVIVVGHGCGPLRMLLVPLLATLSVILGTMDGIIGRHLLAAAWGRLPSSLGGTKCDCLLAPELLLL